MGSGAAAGVWVVGRCGLFYFFLRSPMVIYTFHYCIELYCIVSIRQNFFFSKRGVVVTTGTPFVLRRGHNFNPPCTRETCGSVQWAVAKGSSRTPFEDFERLPRRPPCFEQLGAIGGGASSGAVLRGRLGRGLVIIRGVFPGKGFRGKFRI